MRGVSRPDWARRVENSFAVGALWLATVVVVLSRPLGLRWHLEHPHPELQAELRSVIRGFSSG